MSVLKKNKKSHLKKEMFFDEGVDIQRFDVVKYPQIEKITDKQLGFFWRPEEVDVSKDKKDFANKIKAHINNHICKNIYRKDRGCMELTGGYLEETITVDVNTGRKSCAIYIRTFVDKDLNDFPWEYGGSLFEMPSWC